MNHSSHKKFIQRKEIREIQENKLHELLAYLTLNSPYYQRIFNQKQVDINRIKKLGGPRIITNNQQGRPAII
ncbi:MAG: hypothetical protein WDM78_18050 [Puia sp.]